MELNIVFKKAFPTNKIRIKGIKLRMDFFEEETGMQKKYLVGASVLILGLTFGVTTLTDTSASAASRYVKKVPKRLRGVWYFHDDSSLVGGARLKITAKTYEMVYGRFKKGKLIKNKNSFNIYTGQSPKLKIGSWVVTDKKFLLRRSITKNGYSTFILGLDPVGKLVVKLKPTIVSKKSKIKGVKLIVSDIAKSRKITMYQTSNPEKLVNKGILIK